MIVVVDVDVPMIGVEVGGGDGEVDLRDFQEEGHPGCSQAKGSKVEERLVQLRIEVRFEVLIKKKMYYLGLRRFDLWMEFLMVHLEELGLEGASLSLIHSRGSNVDSRACLDLVLVLQDMSQILDSYYQSLPAIAPRNSIHMLFGSCISVLWVHFLLIDESDLASKALPFTFAIFVVSASLKGLFVVPMLSYESTSSLKELLEVSYRHTLRLHYRRSRNTLYSTRSFLSPFKQEFFFSNFCFDYLGFFLG
ncbi:hypothetical protein Tco_0407992 [Tanacetum coccineum]